MRMAALFPWMHPFAFFHGIRYLGALARGAPRPPGHVLNLLVLCALSALWLFLFASVFLFVL